MSTIEVGSVYKRDPNGSPDWVIVLKVTQRTVHVLELDTECGVSFPARMVRDRIADGFWVLSSLDEYVNGGQS